MIDIIIFLTLLTLGYGFGAYREKKHYRSILEREETFQEILLFDSKLVPDDFGTQVSGGEIVKGHVVISVDYFKRFVAGLRKLFGGNLKTYETLLDRGRREAILRMKEQAKAQNSNMIFNIKFETASISKGASGNIGSVEVYVYGSGINAQN